MSHKLTNSAYVSRKCSAGLSHINPAHLVNMGTDTRRQNNVVSERLLVFFLLFFFSFSLPCLYITDISTSLRGCCCWSSSTSLHYVRHSCQLQIYDHRPGRIGKNELTTLRTCTLHSAHTPTQTHRMHSTFDGQKCEHERTQTEKTHIFEPNKFIFCRN